ncbi:FtsX-like permease family protein [Streptomyces sp. NPDC056716]|uniref:FtsX-like permease family protein n=1 Tax=unclassified Streptomyces TaxID=2593676 RepID=UPI0036C463DF
MLSVALRTLRTRWVTFAGSFVALSLGVALIAVMGLALASSLDAPERVPERFAAAPVVVQGQDTLTVSTPIGDRSQELALPRAVPAATVAALRGLGTVVEDRSFAVRAVGGPADLVGHPWSTAAFAPYEIDQGRAPVAADEVVVSGDWVRPGGEVRTGDGTLRVVGTVTGLGFENAVFSTDARAAELAPVSHQLVVDADPAAVREAVRGSGAEVLTGNARRYADADPDRDSEALTAMNALFGTAGGVTGFVSVFVVASTFAFAVAQRRREFGLLRTAGATPGQLRRMVVAEALGVGVLASAAGCVLGWYGAPKLARWAVGEGLAPRWFGIGDHVWPYHLAFWTGLLVALCGVLAASWRAGRTSPAEALREASVDSRAMTRGRLLCGAALLATAVVMPVPALVGDPGELLQRKTYVSRPMLLITAVALLAPVVVRPLTRLIAWPLAQLPGATGMLVRENAAAGVRRTAAVAAPVLVTVALAGSLLGATATLDAAEAAEVRERTAADLVVVPAGGTGFDAATVARLAAVPGAEIAAGASSAVYVLEDGVALVRSDARAVEPGPLAATASLPLAAGKVSDLDDGSIIVNEEWERHTVGDRVDVWLGDGTPTSLTIAAVMTVGTGDNGVYVTPRNAPAAPVDRVDVRLEDGGDAGAVAAGLREAVGGSGASGGEVFGRDAWVASAQPEANPTTRTGFFLVLGIALLYTGISLANTMVMATSDQVRELAALRLAGATTWQVLRLVGAEALMVVTVGGVLGALVAAVNLLGMWGALGLLSVWTPVEMPWGALGVVMAACAVLAVGSAVVSVVVSGVVSGVVPAGLRLRRRAVRRAGGALRE